MLDLKLSVIIPKNAPEIKILDEKGLAALPQGARWLSLAREGQTYCLFDHTLIESDVRGGLGQQNRFSSRVYRYPR